MWLNESNVSQVTGLAYLSHTTSQDLLLGGISGSWLATYTDSTHLVAAVEAFVNAAGFPWMIIGDLSSITLTDTGLAAINFGAIDYFSDSIPTSGEGITYGGQDIHTPGYTPWSNFSAAQAGLLALLGNVNIPTS